MQARAITDAKHTLSQQLDWRHHSSEPWNCLKALYYKADSFSWASSPASKISLLNSEFIPLWTARLKEAMTLFFILHSQPTTGPCRPKGFLPLHVLQRLSAVIVLLLGISPFWRTTQRWLFEVEDLLTLLCHVFMELLLSQVTTLWHTTPHSHWTYFLSHLVCVHPLLGSLSRSKMPPLNKPTRFTVPKGFAPDQSKLRHRAV